MHFEATETHYDGDYTEGPSVWDGWDGTEVITKLDAEIRIDDLAKGERWLDSEYGREEGRSVFEVKCYDGDSLLWTVGRNVDWSEVLTSI